MLDVATGTGDLAIELAKRVAPGGSVTGADFSEEMLVVAREKQRSALAGVDAEVVFEQGNALDLKYDDDMFDAVTVGFGVRNFSDLAAGLNEMARVVRPGGKFVILEISQPQKGPLSYFYKAWFDGLVPFIGKFAGEDSAYTYLPNSVKRFAAPKRAGGCAARRRHDRRRAGSRSPAGSSPIHHGDRRLTGERIA